MSFTPFWNRKLLLFWSSSNCIGKPSSVLEHMQLPVLSLTFSSSNWDQKLSWKYNWRPRYKDHFPFPSICLEIKTGTFCMQSWWAAAESQLLSSKWQASCTANKTGRLPVWACKAWSFRIKDDVWQTELYTPCLSICCSSPTQKLLKCKTIAVLIHWKCPEVTY